MNQLSGQIGVTATPKTYEMMVRIKLPHQLVLVAGVPSQKKPRDLSSGWPSQWNSGSNVEGRQTTNKLINPKTRAMMYMGYMFIIRAKK
mmetsp:Transcript_33725/g.61985  ORF Transcript_33725/g.61985 Transcript_33725/m.61985 type:complete len:89 (+) Transcript_33725:1542-1808(+)